MNDDNDWDEDALLTIFCIVGLVGLLLFVFFGIL
jgi:hypothetical protein